jgi:hypothetical protein
MACLLGRQRIPPDLLSEPPEALSTIEITNKTGSADWQLPDSERANEAEDVSGERGLSEGPG